MVYRLVYILEIEMKRILMSLLVLASAFSGAMRAGPLEDKLKGLDKSVSDLNNWNVRQAEASAGMNIHEKMLSTHYSEVYHVDLMRVLNAAGRLFGSQQKQINKLRARISKLEGKPKEVAQGKRRSRRRRA